MIVCICHGISDREIEEHIHQGARSVADVARRCGAGTDCGSCNCAVRDMVRRSRGPHTRHGAVGNAATRANS